MRSIALAGLLLPGAVSGAAQSPAASTCQVTLAPRGGGRQVVDTSFDPLVPEPAFPLGQGPLVLLDERHFNFHTLEGAAAPDPS